MPGDGIGKVVLEEAIRVLRAAGFEAKYVHGDIGWEFWCTEGNPLPDRTLRLLEEHKIGLFGAITSKPKDRAAAELDPELRDKGFVYYSPIVSMRQKYDLDICMRPCKTFEGNPLNFIRRGFGNTIEEPMIDTMIFRQNTEGLYGGVEWTNPPDQVYDALMTHPKFEMNFEWCPRPELAVSTRIFTKKYTERIVRAAFEYAKSKGFDAITVCEKPNVIRETSGMMLLDHIEEAEISAKIQQAVADVILEGKVKTYDMMKLPGKPDVFEKGAATTQEIADAMIKKIVK